MSDWTAGYVTDIGYTQGFYRELTPALLSFVALCANVRAPNANAPLAYCELGCGQGLSANLIAAANPHIQVHANDFNPAHIGGARALAAESGATNVHFSDASFADYIDDPSLPEFDMIALHGIYSWISKDNRDAIVRFIDKKLKVGGLAFVSYNCLPGWSGPAPLRHLMYMHGQMTGGPTAGRLDPALAFVDALKTSGANYFRNTTNIDERFAKLKEMDRRYLAHEYMNDAWSLLYFSEVNAEMAAAKLSFISTAHLPDRMDAITLNEAQRALSATITDPVMRETLRDYVQNQQFRRDLYIKGAVPLPRHELDETWLNQRFAMAAVRVEGDLKVATTIGEVNLRPDIYDVLLNKIVEKPLTVREMLADPAVAAMGWPAIREALTLLVGLNRINPALDASGDAKRTKRTQAFNQAVMRRAHSNAELSFLASPITGGGLPVGRMEQLMVYARLIKDPDPAAYVARTLETASERLVKDGKPLEQPEEIRTELSTRDDTLKGQLPLLRQLGIL